jgi:uncharacterized membrane protein
MAYNRTLQHFTSSQELATIWASGQNYIVNQLVLDSDKLYRCNTSHTSGATFAGDSAYWTGLNQGGVIDIAGGGTGQTTATAAFDALAPTTTAGDLIVYNGTDNVRLPVGTDGQMIVADASQTNKLKWATVPQGSKNYITYSNFENNATTGWSLFNTTLTSKIPTGAITSGAASLNALSVTSSTPLAGSYSLSVSSPGAVTAGQGFITDVLTIDREDQAKVLTFSFYYETVSGTMNFSGTSSNTWAIYIHDGTNWIQPAGVYGMTQSSGAGLVTGTFQTNSTGTSYRLAVVCITATGAAISMKFDDFKLSPQTAPIGPVVTDFQVYTPSIAGFNAGTTPTINVRWRRVGDSIHVIGTYIAGGTGIGVSGDMTVFLPSGLSFDSSKISTAVVIGAGEIHNAGAYRYGCSVLSSLPNTFVLSARANAATGGNIVGGTIPETSWWNAGGDQFSFELMAPISGWSSNVQTSDSTDTRVVDFRAYTTSARTVNNTAPTVIFENVDKDSHGAYNASTGVYTVPVSGDYVVSGQMRIGTLTMNAGAFFGFSASVDNVYSVRNHYTAFRAVTASSAGNFAEGSGSVLLTNLSAGQTIRVRGWADQATATFTDGANTFCIQRISGPSVIAATENVIAKYQTVSNTVGSAATLITYGTREIDSHGIYNTSTGVITIPISGKYLIGIYGSTVGANWSAGGQFLWQLRKNGSIPSPALVVTQIRAQTTWNSGVLEAMGNTYIECLAGDTFEIMAQNSLSVALSSTSGRNYFYIVRIGN